MRSPSRIFTTVLSLILALAILVFLYVRQIMSMQPEIRAVTLERPLQEYCTEPTTTHNFDEFWSRFRDAIRRQDKHKLLPLMHTCSFIWERGPTQPSLQLRRADCVLTPLHDCHYPEFESGGPQIFESRNDFDLNYLLIFPERTRDRILNDAPWKQAEGRYYLSWDSARNESMSFVFEDIDKLGYKFTGLEWGPYPVSFLKEEAKHPPTWMTRDSSSPPSNSTP